MVLGKFRLKDGNYIKDIRSSRPKVSWKEGVLKTFTKFTGKYPGPNLESRDMGCDFSEKGHRNVGKGQNIFKIWDKMYKIWKYFEKRQLIARDNCTQYSCFPVNFFIEDLRWMLLAYPKHINIRPWMFWQGGLIFRKVDLNLSSQASKLLQMDYLKRNYWDKYSLQIF